MMNGESKIEYIQVYSVNRKDRNKKIFDFLPTNKMDDKGKTPQVPSYQYFDNLKNSLSSRDAVTPGFTSKMQTGVFKFEKDEIKKKRMENFDM
jgi:hypothetical protein